MIAVALTISRGGDRLISRVLIADFYLAARHAGLSAVSPEVRL
jgi:hypothetical protein